MEYMHASYKKRLLLKDDLTTLEDKVIEYKGRQILVQTNESNTSLGSKVKFVNVVELLEPLYASSTSHSAGLTKARKIESPEEREELRYKIRGLGIKEPINF